MIRKAHDLRLTTNAGESGTHRAKLTLLVPDHDVGVTVARSGPNESGAIARALRGLADQLDADARAARRSDGTTWIRLSCDVDVCVPLVEVAEAKRLEKRAANGDMEAAQSIMDCALGWLGTAMHDKDSRNWQSFDWALVEDCATDDFPEA